MEEVQRILVGLLVWIVLVLAMSALVAATYGCARKRADEPCFSPQLLGLNALLPVPQDNRLTREKIALGERLFFEGRLSRDGKVSCASCHVPELAFSDGKARAVGVEGRVGRRNAPSLTNIAYRSSQFWDGRVASLEEQALQPIENPLEMDHSLLAVVRDLNADDSYRKQFALAFGTPQITTERIAHALATFERTLVSGDAPFDRYTEHGDEDELSNAARRGLALFEGKARCRFCHTGALFSDDLFHNTGVSWGAEPLDLGRYEVTRRDPDKGRFRTPTLRDVARSAPYMHDGSLASLADVIEFYDGGGQPNPYVDPVLTPLELTPSEKADLVEFLGTLSPRETAER